MDKSIYYIYQDSTLKSFDIRDIIDWDYYIDRFGNCVQKIVTIPAAIQRVKNPVPRIIHPPWLQKYINDTVNTHKQVKIDSLFQKGSCIFLFYLLVDIEDLIKEDNNNNNSQIDEIEDENDDENDEDINKNVSLYLYNYFSNDDIQEWYKVRKAEWKKLRETKKRKRQEIYGKVDGPISNSIIIKYKQLFNQLII